MQLTGHSAPLGATVVDGGVNFSLFSRSATGVELLLFEREDDARHGGQAFPEHDDRSRTGQQIPDFTGGQPIQRRSLGARNGFQQPTGHLLQRASCERGDGVHRKAVLAGRLAQPQEHDGRLVFRLEPDQQHHRRRFQIGIAHGHRPPRDAGSEEVGLLG